MITITIAAVVLCIILSAFFSGSETAYTSLSIAQIETLRSAKNPQSRLAAKMANNLKNLLTTILIGNNLVNIIAAVLASNLTIELFGSQLLGATTGIITLFILLFGEVIPKQFAVIYNERWAIVSAPILTVVYAALYPISWIIGLFSGAIGKIDRREPSEQITRKGLVFLMKYAASIGVVDTFKSRWVTNLFRFGDTKVSSIMTHRTQLFSLDSDRKVEEAISEMSRAGFARIPVYKEHAEQITGIVLLKDALNALTQNEGQHTLAELAIFPLFVSETWPIERVWSKLRHAKVQAAIVRDEYGGISGLVTLEDIIEEIMGEIYDEREGTEQSKIVSLGHGRYQITTDISLVDFNDKFDVEIPIDRGMNTLGGYLVSCFGSIPSLNEKLDTPYGEFVVTALDKNRIVHAIYAPTLDDIEQNK